MGNYQDRLMDYDTTDSVRRDHLQLSEDEARYLKKLSEVNGELMNRWFGPAGDVFEKVASTIESELSNTVRFSDNCAVGNDQLLTNFTSADGSRSEALEIQVSGTGN